MIGAGVLSETYSFRLMYLVAAGVSLGSIVLFLTYTLPHYERHADERN
jgi:hypothetical protein